MVPNNYGQLIAEAFRRCDVQVFFSVDDCDDTLANWASLDKAHLVSRDKDFFRYQGDGDFAKRLFSHFDLRDGKLTLVKAREPKKKFPKRLLKQLSKERMRVCESNNYFFPRVTADKTHLLGASSTLTKDLGNSHLTVRSLRQAVYHKLNVPFVDETYPIWNTMNCSVKWVTERVAAGNPEILTELLSTPSFSKLLSADRDSFLQTFYGDTPKVLRRPTSSCSDLTWENHIFALCSIPCALYFSVKDHGSDPRTYTQIISCLRPKTVIDYPPDHRRIAYTL